MKPVTHYPRDGITYMRGQCGAHSVRSSKVLSGVSCAKCLEAIDSKRTTLTTGATQMDNEAKESNHYAEIDRDESRALSFNQLCDRARDEMLWNQLEEAMATAPAAQRKAFWHELLGLIDVEARLIAKQNVSMIAAPLQEAVALAIDEKVRKETSIGRLP